MLLHCESTAPLSLDIMPTFDDQYLDFIRNFKDYPDEMLMNPAHAAALLCISPQTLAKWRMTGDGPKFVKHKNSESVYYRIGDYRKYVAELQSFNNTEEITKQASNIRAFSQHGSSSGSGELDYGDPLPFARVNGELRPFFSTLTEEIEEVVWMTEYEYMQHKFLDGHEED